MPQGEALIRAQYEELKNIAIEHQGIASSALARLADLESCCPFLREPEQLFDTGARIRVEPRRPRIMPSTAA